MNRYADYNTMGGPIRSGHAAVLILFLLMLLTPAARAAFIPFYRMDSLAYMADAVVLCRELSYDPPHTAPMNTPVTWRIGKFLVQKTFKGTVPAGKILTVRLDGTYRRAILEDGIPTYIKQKNGSMALQKVKALPLGQALLFLEWNESAMIYEPVTGGIKLVITGKVYGYGQFLSNPGPLVLAPMKAENISAAVYGLKELLADLAIALDKAKFLKEPAPGEPVYMEK